MAIWVAALILVGAPLQAQQPKVPPVTGAITRLVPPAPTPEGFIADVPGILAADLKARLNARIRALQDSGYGDIGVAIIPSIADFQPYEVGLAIYRTWRVGRVEAIGSARRDLGVLLLIVPKELSPDKKGQCWITTGTGAEGIMTDAASGRICSERIIPFLKTRDYNAALAAGVEGIAERLRGDTTLLTSTERVARQSAEPPRVPEGGIRWWHVLSAVLVTLGGLLGIPVWRRRRPRRCPRCGKMMRRLDETQDADALDPAQRIEEQIKSVDYDVWSCECGKTLVLPHNAWFSSYHQCPGCHHRTASVTRSVVKQPTFTSGGLARDTTTCKACSYVSTQEVTLPRRSAASSSSSGGGSSSGSSGGGGSSFGGSGSSSGGGGGSSY